MKGHIARIQRFSTTNGPGLRSTVFMKGCPLACLWCHNPEMQYSAQQLLVYPSQCTLCGACMRACANGAHILDQSIHKVDRQKCSLCGQCQEVCPIGAIELAGEEIEAQEVVHRLIRDSLFYQTSNGGITLSGGEPLAQFSFTQEILSLAKAEGLHTCLDTSGWGGLAPQLVNLVDLYLWDIKETDPDRYLQVTGVELAPIIDSLYNIDKAGGKVRLRCPIVPGVNNRDTHINEIGALVSRLSCVVAIDLVPYHRLGLAKADALGIEQQEFQTLDNKEKEHYLLVLSSQTDTLVQWI